MDESREKPETAKSFGEYIQQNKYKYIVGVIGAIGMIALPIVFSLLPSSASPDTNLIASRFEQYIELGEVGRRAAVFIDHGTEGSPADVRAVYRHFRVLVADRQANRVTDQMLADTYLGQLAGWSNRFGRLSRSEANVSRRFAAEELDNFRLMARFLGATYAHRSLAEPGATDPGRALDETMNSVSGNGL